MFDNIFFVLSAFATCGGAVGVAVARNLMHSCVYLLLTLFGMAGLYATLGADFLAAAQLVIYGGGVVILMLFAVMLTGGAENRINRFGLKKNSWIGECPHLHRRCHFGLPDWRNHFQIAFECRLSGRGTGAL